MNNISNLHSEISRKVIAGEMASRINRKRITIRNFKRLRRSICRDKEANNFLVNI